MLNIDVKVVNPKCARIGSKSLGVAIRDSGNLIRNQSYLASASWYIICCFLLRVSACNSKEKRLIYIKYCFRHSQQIVLHSKFHIAVLCCQCQDSSSTEYVNLKKLQSLKAFKNFSNIHFGQVWFDKVAMGSVFLSSKSN